MEANLLKNAVWSAEYLLVRAATIYNVNNLTFLSLPSNMFICDSPDSFQKGAKISCHRRRLLAKLLQRLFILWLINMLLKHCVFDLQFTVSATPQDLTWTFQLPPNRKWCQEAYISQNLSGDLKKWAEIIANAVMSYNFTIFGNECCSPLVTELAVPVVGSL